MQTPSSVARRNELDSESISLAAVVLGLVAWLACRPSGWSEDHVIGLLALPWVAVVLYGNVLDHARSNPASKQLAVRLNTPRPPVR